MLTALLVHHIALDTHISRLDSLSVNEKERLLLYGLGVRNRKTIHVKFC